MASLRRKSISPMASHTRKKKFGQRSVIRHQSENVETNYGKRLTFFRERFAFSQERLTSCR